ncbi:Hypothetical Protein RSKD131_4383 (plasmid) [Cereibacter sphaeroides KD131]|nr:Hypothetical Protein RSKD131_4383 [Cereibacter sphaeroides KD131]
MGSGTGHGRGCHVGNFGFGWAPVGQPPHLHIDARPSQERRPPARAFLRRPVPAELFRKFFHSALTAQSALRADRWPDPAPPAGRRPPPPRVQAGGK